MRSWRSFDLARWWPLPYAALFLYAPLDLDALGDFEASKYYAVLFPPAAFASAMLAYHPTSDRWRTTAVLLATAACVSRSLAILQATAQPGPPPIAGLAGLVWLVIGYGFVAGSVLSWMDYQKRRI